VKAAFSNEVATESVASVTLRQLRATRTPSLCSASEYSGRALGFASGIRARPRTASEGTWEKGEKKYSGWKKGGGHTRHTSRQRHVRRMSRETTTGKRRARRREGHPTY